MVDILGLATALRAATTIIKIVFVFGAAGGDPVMGARQLSGSLADLWPETANHLARSAGRGLENDHSRTRNALAQWQHGSRPARCAPTTRPTHT